MNTICGAYLSTSTMGVQAAWEIITFKCYKLFEDLNQTKENNLVCQFENSFQSLTIRAKLQVSYRQKYARTQS